MGRRKKEETLALATKENILLGNNNNENLKNELKKYVDERINKVFVEELDKSNRKLLREKSRKIFIKNIIIILLLLIIGFLTYLLYTSNYFDHFFNKTSEIKENTEVKEEEKKEETQKEEVKEEKVPTLTELKSKYGKLLDNYVISEKCAYLIDFYQGNLTSNIKHYFTLNSFDFTSLKKEDDYHIILNDTFKLAYERLFNGDYDSSSFDYNGNSIRYVSMISSYMSTTLLAKEDSLIKREISDIKEKDGEVLITTVEGLVKDGKLYTVVDDTLVEGYKEDNLLKYSDSLDKLVYTFKDGKLISLSK